MFLIILCFINKLRVSHHLKMLEEQQMMITKKKRIITVKKSFFGGGIKKNVQYGNIIDF